MEYLVSAIFLLISILLGWFLISSEKGPKEPKGGLFAAFGFGILALLIASPLDYLLFGSIEELENSSLLNMFFSSIGTGLLEESLKFIPLALYIFKKPYFFEHSDGIIYFAIVGLTFGFVENSLYTIDFGVEVGLSRLFMVPIFHGASTAIAGYFLAKQKIYSKDIKMTVVALLVISFMHGLYNYGLFTGSDYLFMISLMLTLLYIIGLFLLYDDAKRKDLLMGLTVKGPNRYCKYCGSENIKRSLYCEYCGKRL